MEQVFSCQKCGAQNPVGQTYCRSCGERFEYRCSNCNGIIILPARFCANCGAKLNLPNTQNTAAAAERKTTHSGIKGNYRFIEGTQPKQNNASLMGFIGLMVGIVVIVSGVMFAADSDLLKIALAPPRTVSPQIDNTPAPLTTPVSEPADLDTVYSDVPEYVQQYTINEARFAKASGEAANLINNPNAENVSFDELKAFILKDTTDEEDYIVGVRMCVDFAEALHNNAEQAGIKAAVVGIKFQDEEIGHAINAFLTTDKGLVYVDCTGEGIKPVAVNEWIDESVNIVKHDKIAYMEKGENYGVISIEKARSLQYDYYIEYMQDWQRCKDMVEVYNEEVLRYNDEVEGKTFYQGSQELAEVQAWKAELVEKEEQIKELAEMLGNYLFEQLGIVDTVMLYW
jgi:hypothetical protein